jgi:hypothetical protein
MAQDDLVKDVNQETRRMSTLFLGFSAAAIGFGVHEISSWDQGLALVPVAFGGAAWAASFYCGIEWVHSQQLAMKAAIGLDILDAADARTVTAKAMWHRAVGRTQFFYRWQLRGLLVGALLFAIGQGVRITTPPAVDIANGRRCIAIQRDMLSAMPRRADGPDLFRALGCRPQGEGNVYAAPESLRMPQRH